MIRAIEFGWEAREKVRDGFSRAPWVGFFLPVRIPSSASADAFRLTIFPCSVGNGTAKAMP
jgi:hypothetical protein